MVAAQNPRPGVACFHTGSAIFARHHPRLRPTSSAPYPVVRAQQQRSSGSKYHPPLNRLNSRPTSFGGEGGVSSAGSATNTPNSSSNNRWTEWLLYSYFNWRKDTISDLVLFAGLNFGLVFIVWLLTLYTHVSDSLSLYAIGQILVGQELPEESSIDMGTQVFVVSMGLFGLASFAVVLALVEQAVLEILEANVRQGSNVIEEDHVVLLSWGTSTRDIAQTIRIVKEICASQQYSWIKKGRLSIVVLSQGREKLEMESLFDRALPESMRAGCRLVFRQGSPLDPGALDMVSVATAKTVIISGDYSARCRESDAQVLRSAILVDEMLQSAMQNGARDEKKHPRVVVETQTKEGDQLCNEWTSQCINPVLTTRVNALRTARMLWHPAASVVSHSLFDHNSVCFIGLCRSPGTEYVGRTIKELQRVFAYATPFGFVNERAEDKSKSFVLNPSPERQLQPGEGIVLFQSAQREAATIVEYIGSTDGSDEDEPWTEDRLQQSQTSSRAQGMQSSATSSGWGSTVRGDDSGSTGGGSTSNGDDPCQPPGPFPVLPAAALTSFDYVDGNDGGAGNFLITGWPGISYSMELVRAIDSKLGKECKTGANGIAESCASKGHILVLNQHDPVKIEKVLESLRHELRNCTISHRQCDPRNRYELETVLSSDELVNIKGALTLVDVSWFRSERDDADGESSADFSLTSASMLKMDSLILNCQLNLRQMLKNAEISASPSSLRQRNERSGDMIFIGERLAGESRCTKFEDRARLPTGSSVNSSSFAAKALAQEAILPGSMRLYNKVDEVCRLVIVDASFFAERDEVLSYARLQSRVADMASTLMGFYDKPGGSSGEYVSLTMNLQGFEAKHERRVWNDGSGKRMLIIAASRTLYNILQAASA